MRVQKTVGGVTHTYTYLGDRLVCEEWGSCYIYYIYDETGRPYGLIYCDGTNTDNYYFLRNLQGDVLELMEMNGETVAFYEYDPWGKVLSVKDASGNAITSATHIANVNPIRYRGYYYDTESGFYYLRSRYYDPEVCRFINPDSYLSTGQGVLGCNMFAYCSNDPVNYADHTGCIAANVVGALVGGIIGVVGGAFLGNWLADRIGLKGWERWVFVGGVSILIGATATAIGYLVGPYIAKAWTFFKGQLANLLKSSFKSVAKLSSNDLTHIMKSKHLWHKVLKNVTEKGVEELIKEAVKKGIWDLAENGVATITYKYAGQTIIVTGKIVEGVFRVGTSYVK